MIKELITQEIKLTYQVLGSGKPVMLLHGFAEDSEVWQSQIDFLQSHYQLFIPDLPGTGSSEFLKPVDTVEGFSHLEYYAELIYQLMLKEKITEFILLGHSMGGYITLAFAEKYPQYLKGFGLIHSTAFADNTNKKKTRDATIAFLAKHRTYELLKTSLPNLFSKKYKENHREKVQYFIEKYSTINSKVLQVYTKAMKTRPDRTSVLNNAQVPVLFIMGEEDTAAPLQDLLKQVKLPKISYIHIIEETGHMGMLEKNKIVNINIMKYLQESLP